MTKWLFLLLALLALVACGGDSTPEVDPVWDALFVQEGMRVDTVGVRDLTQSDTLSDYPGVVIIDRQFTFQPGAEGGEVFAWEYYAQALNPIKLIVVKFEESGEFIEIIGESEMIVPEHKGLNRHVLHEPIPIALGCMMGLVQPQESAIPFRNLRGYKTLITARPFQRPLMRRDAFAMYGWRYALRVFWRQKEKDNS